MPDIFETIQERRSVRKYKTHPLPQELIEKILVAAGCAPSAHNAQPWRFVVLVDRQVKKRLAEAMAMAWAADLAKDGASVEPETFKLRVERFASAPILVLACFSMDGMVKHSDSDKRRIERDLAMQSLAAAIQNLLLAAHNTGLGACWFCAPAFCKETVRQVLIIPRKVEPEALIALGFPDEAPEAPTRKRLDEYCFKDKWGGRFS